MAITRQSLSLYLVTDPFLCAQTGLVETVTAALKGGVANGSDARRKRRERERSAAIERIVADVGDAVHADAHERRAAPERIAALI